MNGTASQWHDQFLVSGQAGLKSRTTQAVDEDSRWLQARIWRSMAIGCFRHQLLLPRPYLVLTKPLRLDIQCQPES